MRVKFGSVVTDGRGKIGGHVVTKDNAGAALRNKKKGSKFGARPAVGAALSFPFISSSWRNLSDDQREAWNSTVFQIPVTDIFGDLKIKSGFQLYQQLNMQLFLAGQSLIDEPPPDFSVTQNVCTSIDVNGFLGSIDVYFAGQSADDHYEIIECSRGLSPGVSSPRGNFNTIGRYHINFLEYKDITNDYFSIYFNPLPTGSKVFCRCRSLNALNGMVSVYSKAFDIRT